jgi:hypothetical protein
METIEVTLGSLVAKGWTYPGRRDIIVLTIHWPHHDATSR